MFDPTESSFDRRGGAHFWNLHGAIGCGKTFAAASVSKAFPSTLPAPKRVQLADMFWLGWDSQAVAGFKHNNIDVPYFDPLLFMSNADVYKKAGFQRQPSVIETMNYALRLIAERVAAKKTTWVVDDTTTSRDMAMLMHHTKLAAGSANQYEAYKLNLTAHEMFYVGLKQTGANVMCLFHTRVASDDPKKNAVVLVAGGAQYVPDVTGQAAKVYKRDPCLQLFIKAVREPGKKKLARKVLVGINDAGEGKNRYEGLLPDELPTNNLQPLVHLLEKGKK